MRVLLVHGLGRTAVSLRSLKRCLRRAGHQPETFSYFAFAQPYQAIRDRLAAQLAAMRGGGPVALIGHSLGGLLLRDALAAVPDLPVHRLIMLGTPNKPPRRARLAMRWLPWRMFARSCGELLATPAAFAAIPRPAVPYTLVAGTAGHRLLSAPFGEELHDGFVAVSETRIDDADEPVLLPLNHTFMMNDDRLQGLIVELLQQSGGARRPDVV